MEETQTEQELQAQESIPTENTEAIDYAAENLKLREQLSHKEKYIRKQQSQLDKIKGQSSSQAKSVPSQNAPKASDFENYDAYIDALVDFKISQGTGSVEDKMHNALREIRASEKNAERIKKFEMAVDQFKRQEAPDFEEVARSETMRNIYASARNGLGEILEEMGYEGAQVAYYISENIDEAYRLAELPVHKLVTNIMALRDKAKKRSQKTLSSAPTPVNPIKGTHTPRDKSPDDMTDEEWRAWRKQRKR